MSSTQNLLDEHLIVRRLASIAKKCSDRLYCNHNIPIEDIQIISVVIEDFQKISENSSLNMSLEEE